MPSTTKRPLSKRIGTIGIWFALLVNHVYDWRRYARHSFVLGAHGRENRRAMLHILTHSLEHGMALPVPRRGFGQEKARSLLQKANAYQAEFGADSAVAMAVSTLDSYVAWHRKKGTGLGRLPVDLEALKARCDKTRPHADGGVTMLARAEVAEATDFDFDRFMRTRHSVRQYTPEPVSRAAIERAIANAQRSPSVCNRQPCKVFALTQKRAIEKVLTLQSGNAGFAHEVRALFIVTANMEHMNLIGERYQGWIDGGIFAMALALSLHAQGLGACFLNWSVPARTDRKLRALVGIPDGELVITMMSAGHLKESFAVPVSHRKALCDALVIDPPMRG